MCWVKRKLKNEKIRHLCLICATWESFPSLACDSLSWFFLILVSSQASFHPLSSYSPLYSLAMSCSHSLSNLIHFSYHCKHFSLEPSLTFHCLLYNTSPFKCPTRTSIYTELIHHTLKTCPSSFMPYPPTPSGQNSRNHW